MQTAVSDDGEFVLTITNDGEPFDPAVATKNGRGIANIRARAALINATTSWKTSKKTMTNFELRKRTDG